MKSIITSDKAPAAIGPYSHATATGCLVFTSGQLPVDPKTGAMPEGVAQQAEQALKNVAAVLEAAGTSLKHALKMTVFIKNMNDFPVINEAYAKFFDGDFPARSCVEVARLPKDALVEIECVAERHVPKI